MLVDHEFVQEPRPLAEIIDAIDELVDKIWYDRHMQRRQRIEEGRIKLVDQITDIRRSRRDLEISREIWTGALKAAKGVELKYGARNLGPYTKFDWGMLNGKLSALRWVLGDDWDMLDT